MISASTGESRRPLSIGVIEGRNPGEPFRAAARDAESTLRTLSEHVVLSETSGELTVNVVFMIPGVLMPIDFEGQRSGRFSRRECRLVVETAVGDECLTDERTALQFIVRSLTSAVEVASYRLTTRDRHFSLAAAHAMALRMAEATA